MTKNPPEPVHFPDLIETYQDTPKLLTALLGPGPSANPIEGLVFSRVNDVPVETGDDFAPIRVGSGEGCGYVVRRPFDGQLVFMPDAGFTGVALIPYTVQDVQGEEATLLATISVQPEPEQEPAFGLAHGETSFAIPSGVQGAILGALSSGGDSWLRETDVRVFEGDAAIPSDRFEVLNGTLRLVEPLGDELGGQTIELSVVASIGDEVIGRCQIDIAVGGCQTDQFHFNVAPQSTEADLDEARVLIEDHRELAGVETVLELDGLPLASQVQNADAPAETSTSSDDVFGM